LPTSNTGAFALSRVINMCW